MRPFNSSIAPSASSTNDARYERHPAAFQPRRANQLRMTDQGRPSRGPGTLFRGDALRSATESFDAILDLAERGEPALDMPVRDIAQHVACNRVAQTVEIVDELAPAPGQEQT